MLRPDPLQRRHRRALHPRPQPPRLAVPLRARHRPRGVVPRGRGRRYELAVFHSHPETQPIPSKTDQELSGLWGGKTFLIYGLAARRAARLADHARRRRRAAALAAERDDGRRPELGRAVQRLDHARLRERVGAAEQRLGLAADRVAQVLELEPVRVDRLDLDPLDARRRGAARSPGLRQCHGSSRKSEPSLPIASSSSRSGSAVPQSNCASTSPGKRIVPGEDPVGAGLADAARCRRRAPARPRAGASR